jgi:hypothetical protein
MGARYSAEALQKAQGDRKGALSPTCILWPPMLTRHPVRTRQPAPRLTHLPDRPARRTAQGPPSRPRGTAAAGPRPALVARCEVSYSERCEEV